MAGTHGKSAVFRIYDSGGTLRDISSNLTSVSPSWEVPSEETTGFTATAQSHVVGIEGMSLSIEGNWDDTASTGTDTILWGIKGTLKGWYWCPAGSSAGHAVYSGSAFLTAYNPTANVRGKLGFTGTLLCSGAVSRNTI